MNYSPFPAVEPTKSSSGAPTGLTSYADNRSEAVNSVVTAAEARRAIKTWTDLSLDRRRGLDSAVKGVVEMLSVDGAALLLDCEALNATLFRRAPAAHGLTPQRFGNIVSALRFVMRRVGACDPDLRGHDGLNDEWSALRTLLPQYRQWALATFLGFCSARGIAPANVSQITLQDFEAWLRTRTLTDHIPKMVRAIASTWTWATGAIKGWPQGTLERPNMRRTYTLPLTAYSPTFQADVERYLAHQAGADDADPFNDDVFGEDDQPSMTFRGRRGYRSARTVETRRYQIRQAAAALILSGIDPASLAALTDLVVPIERAKIILSFYHQRAGKKATTQTAGIYEILRQIATFEARVSEKDLARLKHWSTRVVPPPRKEMTRQNRERLMALLVPRNKEALLHLPQELMKQVREGKFSGQAAARIVAYATALEILLCFPMRRENLANLRLDRHLMRLDPTARRITHIFLTAEEVKNDTDFQWPVEAGVAQFVQTYIDRFRPAIAEPGNPYLFVGPGLKARSAHELALGLKDFIGQQLGLEVNIHLLRAFAVAVYLERNPGNYEVARQILGHKKISTTMAFYAGLEAAAAARHFGETVLAERVESRARAAVAFAGRHRRGGKR